MSYTIKEIPNDEKPYKIIDATGRQVAESTALDKAQRYIFYREQGDKKNS